MRESITLIFLLIGLHDSYGLSFFDFIVQPQQQTATEHEDVVIDCITYDNVTWQREGHLPLPQNAVQQGNRLIINSIKVSDSGGYVCYNRRTSQTKLANVYVIPSSTTKSENLFYSTSYSSPSSYYTQNEYSENRSERFYFKLSTSGLPTSPSTPLLLTSSPVSPYPCLYGFCNGTCCKRESVEEYFDCSNGQKINKTLVCNRENDCADGSDESRCTPWPPKITFLPKHEVEVFCGDQENEKSGTLILECRSVGHPMPVIRWKKYDGHIPSKCQQYSKRGYGTLTCPDFKQSDQGAYSCVAENSVKMAESQPKSIAKCSNTINCKGFRVVNAENIEHCFECYCSGRTSQCQGIKSDPAVKTFPFPEGQTEIFASENGKVVFIPQIPDLNPNSKIRQSMQEITYCMLTKSDFEETSFLKSFGRNVIIPRYKGKANFLSEAPDLIIKGNNISLVYKVNLIPPLKESLTYIYAKFWPGNWYHLNGKAATREDLMKVLSNVDTLFVRCEYTQGSFVTWNETATISLETSVITDFATSVSYVEKCNCPAGYDGLSCEKCADGYQKIPQGDDFICKKIYVPPPCDDGYIGPLCKSCDTAKGYVKKGDLCVKPVCHPQGSTSVSPDYLGRCSCKEGVSGNYCDECSKGYFHLGESGCLKCWCNGVTDQCESSNLYRAAISNTPRGGYNSSDGRNFWLLPPDFSGNRLTSYGGYLNYTMKYKPGIAKEIAYLTVEFLSMDDITLIYTHPLIDRSTLKDDKSWSVPIVENNWKNSDKSSVSRGEFLSVLSKIKAIYIESPYHLSSGQANLTSTRMSFAAAADGYDSESAGAVERCSCPKGYSGLSCENCSDGYYKKRNGTITQCIKCDCNNCDPELGCPDCPGMTYRDNPEDEKVPICKPCPCNGNGISCLKDDHQQIFCRCKQGFTGMHCENALPNESDELRVSISPRKIRGKKVGAVVSVSCSFHSNESLILSAVKRYKTQANNSQSSSLTHSGPVTNREGKTKKNFEVVLEDGLESVECLVHDASGKLAGCVVAPVEDLIVIIKPVQIQNCYSDRIDVKESESKDIICIATGSPPPVVNWYKLVGGTSPPESVPVDTSLGVHTIKSASLKDNGTIYTCVAENAEGDKQTCTQVLIVRKKCEVINIIPKPVTAEEMSNISIQCKTTANSSVSWRMYDPVLQEQKTIFSSRITQSNGHLRITNAQLSDSGTYICTANGRDGSINNTVLVTIEEKKVPPTAVIQEYDKVLRRNETFVVTCLGKGTPTPSISWRKLNGFLDRNVYASGNILTISEAMPQNAGTYECEARSSLGTAFDHISIEVEETTLPPRVNVSEESIGAHDGETVSLTCLAIGYPRPKLSWLAPNIVFTKVSRSNNDMILFAPQESIKEEVTFKVSKEMDGTIIACNAENSAGRSQKEAQIKILQSQVSLNETVEFVPIGSYFELICDTQGEIKWEKLGGLVGDECPIPNGLMIMSVQSQHNGSYICKSNSNNIKIINLIVVGFVPKFSRAGKSFLVLPARQRSSHDLRVEMTFYPESENGLLLKKDNSKFGIYLENGIIYLGIHLKNNDFLVIKMKSPIRLRKWFSLVVTINRMYVDVTVYSENMKIHDRKTENVEELIIAMGHGNDSFFVGGYTQQRHPMGLVFPHVSHFSGCVSRLSIDRHEFDIVKESSYSDNVTLCRRCSEEKNLCGEKGKCFDAPTQYGFICVCPENQENKGICPQSCAGKGCETQLDLCALLKPCSSAFSFSNKCTNNMYSLKCTCAYGYAGTICEKVQRYSFCTNGNGYVRLPSNLLERPLGEREVIRMAFTLTSPDGQLLWQGDKANHLSIAAVGGRIRYAYWNQYSRLTVHSSKLELDKKHTLLVKRFNETVVMELNVPSENNPAVYRNSSSKYYTNRVTGDIYLGNVPNNTFHAGHAGLRGCIHYISFGNKPKINLPEKELEKVNILATSKLHSRSSYESDESEYNNELESEYDASQ